MVILLDSTSSTTSALYFSVWSYFRRNDSHELIPKLFLRKHLEPYKIQRHSSCPQGKIHSFWTKNFSSKLKNYSHWQCLVVRLYFLFEDLIELLTQLFITEEYLSLLAQFLVLTFLQTNECVLILKTRFVFDFLWLFLLWQTDFLLILGLTLFQEHVIFIFHVLWGKE